MQYQTATNKSKTLDYLQNWTKFKIWNEICGKSLRNRVEALPIFKHLWEGELHCGLNNLLNKDLNFW